MARIAVIAVRLEILNESCLMSDILLGLHCVGQGFFSGLKVLGHYTRFACAEFSVNFGITADVLCTLVSLTANKVPSDEFKKFVTKPYRSK